MQTVVLCTHCGMQLGIPEISAGRLIQCPSCMTVFSPVETNGPVGPGQSPRNPEHNHAGGRSDRALSEGGPDSLGQNQGLGPIAAWILGSIAGLVLISGGIFLAWHLALRPMAIEGEVVQVKKPVANLDPEVVEEVSEISKDMPAVPPSKKQDPDHEAQPPRPKNEAIANEEPKREEPQKEPAKIDPSKTDAPKAQDARKEEMKQAEPPKDEIIIAGDGWFEVNCLQGRFYVALPALPVFGPIELPKLEFAGPGYSAKHPREELVFRAGSAQVRDNPPADPWEAHLVPMVRRQLRGLVQFTRTKDISHEGQAGREFLAMAPTKIGVAGRFFSLEHEPGKPRMFFFTVTGPNVRLDSPDVRKFLMSVKFAKGDIFLSKSNGLPEPAEDFKPQPVKEEVGSNNHAGKKDVHIKPQDANSLREKKPSPIAKGDAPSGPGPAEVGKIAGKLNAHLGAVVDLDAKAALLLLPGGQAKLYTYPEFQPLGNYKLAAGTAYRPLYEKAKGRLFALTPNPKAKDPVGKAGGSQVAVYEIRALLEGRLNAQTEVTPAKMIPLGGFCSQLCLSPDGAWLYALDTVNPKALKVVRVDAAKGEIAGSLPVPEFTGRLTLARDGKTLYALSHLAARTAKGPPPQGAVLVIDPDGMKLTKTIPIPMDPFDMEATKEGIIFVSGYGGVRSEILVVDTGSDMAVVAGWKGIPPGSCLKLSDDERRLYVSNWKGAPATVTALAIPEVLADSDLPKTQWAQSPPIPARGEMTITPDNQFLLCDSGVVFFLTSGSGKGTWAGGQ